MTQCTRKQKNSNLCSRVKTLVFFQKDSKFKLKLVHGKVVSGSDFL